MGNLSRNFRFPGGNTKNELYRSKNQRGLLWEPFSNYSKLKKHLFRWESVRRLSYSASKRVEMAKTPSLPLRLDTSQNSVQRGGGRLLVVRSQRRRQLLPNLLNRLLAVDDVARPGNLGLRHHHFALVHSHAVDSATLGHSKDAVRLTRETVLFPEFRRVSARSRASSYTACAKASGSADRAVLCESLLLDQAFSDFAKLFQPAVVILPDRFAAEGHVLDNLGIVLFIFCVDARSGAPMPSRELLRHRQEILGLLRTDDVHVDKHVLGFDGDRISLRVPGRALEGESSSLELVMSTISRLVHVGHGEGIARERIGFLRAVHISSRSSRNRQRKVAWTHGLHVDFDIVEQNRLVAVVVAGGPSRQNSRE